MKRCTITEGMVWMAVGVVVALLSVQTGLGSFREPGSGFIAFAAGLLLFLVGLAMLLNGLAVKEMRIQNARVAVIFPKEFRMQLMCTIFALFVYAAVLELLGYPLSTLLLMWLLFLDWHRPRFISSGLASLGVAAATYLVFDVWLRCQLPKGMMALW